jgi:predicted ATPase
LFNQSLFTEKFKYLSTARIVPRLYYTSSHYEEKIANPLGNDGRNVIEYLVLKGTKELLLKNLSHKDGFSEKGESLPLIDQVEAWMGEICPGTKIEARKDDITKLSNIMYSFKRGNTTIGEFSPINVGFGITHVLPVIVALLSAESGEMIIIIENPETNLHPRGQAKLAELIALTAQNGVQIFIETHSDHIINGTLVAIKKFRTEQKGISHDKVRIFYFERDESTHASQAIPVPVLEGGYIKEVPQGFFDQIEKDMEIMMGF